MAGEGKKWGALKRGLCDVDGADREVSEKWSRSGRQSERRDEKVSPNIDFASNELD